MNAPARLFASWQTLYALIRSIPLSRLPLIVAQEKRPILSLPVWVMRVTLSPVMERRLPPGWYLHWWYDGVESILVLLG